MTNTPNSPVTSTSLLLRLKQNDEAAWGRFDRFYQPLVQRICVRHGIQFNDRDDIMQLVTIKVHKNIANFQRQRDGSFRTWLRMIVKTQIAEFFRSRGKAKDIEYMDNIAEPTAAEVADEDMLLYQEAVKCMEEFFPEKSVKCFIRMTVRGQSAKAIAEELGMSEGAVRKAKFDVLKRLREEFAEFLDAPQRPEAD